MRNIRIDKFRHVSGHCKLFYDLQFIHHVHVMSVILFQVQVPAGIARKTLNGEFID